MKKFTTLILAATLSTLSSRWPGRPTSSSTLDSDSPKQMLVRYADLDLARSYKARRCFSTAYRAAAKIVCAPLESKDPARLVMFQNCVSDAMARAVTQVDRPGLNAYYRGKVPGSNAAPIAIASSNDGPTR